MRRATLFVLAGAIAACSGGNTGTNTPPPPPPPPPVATVELSGAGRVKVGDSYPLAVVARTGDGTIVQRTTTWAVVEAGRATVSPAGVVVAQQSGNFTVRATVEGVAATLLLTGYDWVPVTAPGIVGLGLDADVAVSNKFGTSDYPSLVLGCVDGSFVVGVGTDHIVTASGNVTYAFDGGAPISDVWFESDDFSTLGYPGLTNLSQKNFANAIAASSRFHFTFSEFQAGPKVTVFRVTGLTARLVPVLAACPSNALRDGDQQGVAAESVARLVARLSAAMP